MSLQQSLIETNVIALQEGAELLALLEENQYTQGYKPAFQSTIGAHFRHLLEHYRCLLKHLSSGVVNYDCRERDQLLEQDAEYANQTIQELINALQQLSGDDFDRSLVMHDMQASGDVHTNLHRELLFLQSHTAHHYAIIGAMTRAFGMQPDEDFGVAIATREHQKSVKSDSTVGDAPSCAQ